VVGEEIQVHPVRRCNVFGDQIISCLLRPVYFSPGLIPHAFYVWGIFKDHTYTNSRTEGEI